MKRRAILSIIVFASAMLLLIGSASAQMPGAIWTTDVGCGGVNINIFGSKMDVYLNGGPSGSGAPGLPPGNYYVKVTEPDGTLLGYTTTPSVVVGSDGRFTQCYQLWSILVKASNATQGYDTTTNPGGVYKVWVSQNSDFPPGYSKTDNFKVIEEDGGGPPQETATLTVKKFYDADVDGTKDTTESYTESYLDGWKIGITGANNFQLCGFTPYVTVLDPGTYTVFEYMPLQMNWVNTTPSSVEVTLSAGDNKLVEFGNVCLGPGGGRTLGFWSNKNGQAQMNDGGTMAPELSMLSGLNLRDAYGNHFDPTSYPQFRTWLLGANAVNMAYMLSAQLSAMALNVEAGFVNGSSIVYAPGCGNMGLGNNFITISDLMNKANTSLGSYGSTPSGHPERPYQECLKNALDNANNNKNFVQPHPCPYGFEPCS